MDGIFNPSLKLQIVRLHSKFNSKKGVCIVFHSPSNIL